MKANQLVSSSSKEMAKERLKSILNRDRVEISTETLEALKTEIIAVAKDYFIIKEHGSDVYITTMRRNSSEENETLLVCLIPVSKTKQ